MHFQGFPKEGIAFLSDIIVNNSKAWLDAHKERYEHYIVSPNKAYVEEMGDHLRLLVPTLHAIPKVNKSLFRIYRDARFHRNDPIKERIGIIMWQGATHRMQSSAFYMHYDPFEVFVATGIRRFKPPLLSTYRNYIKEEKQRASLHHIFETLKAKGYKIPQPTYKRFPRGLESLAEKPYGYLAKYDAIYAYTTYTPDETFHSEKVIERHFQIYQDMLDIQQWVYALTLSQNS